MLATPRDHLAFTQREQQLELFGKQLVVVVQVLSKQRIRLNEAAAPSHDFSASTRQQVERRKILEDAHRIVRTEYSHSARKSDSRRSRRGRRQNQRRCRHHKVRTVMLTDPEHVQADLIGKHNLLDKIGHALSDHARVVGRTRIGFAERVDA